MLSATHQLLEVVDEGIEDVAAALDQLYSRFTRCFVSSFASDYSEMHARDLETGHRERSSALRIPTTSSHRLGHFLSIENPRQNF